MGQINELLEISLSSIRDMIDASMIVGSPLVYNNISIIPISRLMFTFISGGSDIKGVKSDVLFGGGSGGGAIVSPICFLVINDNDVRVLTIETKSHITESILQGGIDLVSNISKIITENTKREEI